MSTNIQLVKEALSVPRLSTYESKTSANVEKALELYMWNAQVSAAFLVPLHICEVVIRNAVSEALEKRYGESWLRSGGGFERSLEKATWVRTVQPILDEATQDGDSNNINKLIPKFPFVFWEHMFTKRYHDRLWQPYLTETFPYLDTRKSEAKLRWEIHEDLYKIRQLRNRIAHHEPILDRNLTDDIQRINKLVKFRCQETASWVSKHELVTHYISQKPI